MCVYIDICIYIYIYTYLYIYIYRERDIDMYIRRGHLVVEGGEAPELLNGDLRKSVDNISCNR